MHLIVPMKRGIRFLAAAAAALAVGCGGPGPKNGQGSAAAPIASETKRAAQPADDGGGKAAIARDPIESHANNGPILGPGGRRLVVGFSQIGAESAWRTAESQSIRAEAEARGVDLRFSDAQQKQENQIKALKVFIAQRVDAIILAPVVETGWEPVLAEAKQAGIPVILADRAVKTQDPSLYFTLVSPDVVEEGRMAGRWLAKALDGKGNVAELTGTPGSSPANDRARGFREAIAASRGVKIVKSQTGDFRRAEGKVVMEAFLKSGQKLDALFAHNDDMALGAIQAIEEAGLRPGKDILIVSIDGVRSAFEAVAAGKMNCTVECNPLLGPLLFNGVDAAVHGKPMPKKVSLKERLFERSDAEKELPSRKY